MNLILMNLTRASSFKCVSVMVLRRNVFSRLRTGIDLAHVHEVTGIVSKILGKLILSTKGKTSVSFEGRGPFSM